MIFDLTPQLLLTMLVALVSVIIGLAVAAELIIEFFAPLFNKLDSAPAGVKRSVVMAATFVVGFLCAWSIQADINKFIPFLPMVIPLWASYVIFAVLVVPGSRFWHSVLEFVEKLQQNLPAKK